MPGKVGPAPLIGSGIDFLQPCFTPHKEQPVEQPVLRRARRRLYKSRGMGTQKHVYEGEGQKRF